MKTKEQSWKENHGIQHIHIEDLQGNIIIDKRQVDEYRKYGRIILQSGTIDLINQKTKKLNLKRKYMQTRGLYIL
jgi:hypothetical protein